MHESSTSSVDQNAIISEIDLPDPAATLSWSDPRWSQDGTHIVVERQMDGRAWPRLDDHRADVGPLLVLVGLVVGLWWLVRTWRRPRQVGRHYCQRCNHDIGGSETKPERCGECGGVLAGRGTVVGRSRWRRLGPTLALAALLVAGGAFLARGAIVRSSPFAFGNRTAWPVAALDRFPDWPLWRADTPWISTRRLDVVAIDAEGQLRLVQTSAIEPPPNALWCMSNDGRTIAWSRFDESNDWRQEVCWFDVDANVEGSTFVGSNADGFLRVCGFAPDGRSIVVRRDRLVAAPYENVTAPDGATLARYKVEVLVIDPGDGKATVMATAEAFALAQGLGSWRLEPGLVVLGSGPRATWASFTLSNVRPPAQSPYVARIASLTVGNGTEQREIDVQGEPAAFFGDLTSTIVDDRELVIDATNRTIGGSGLGCTRYRIDLATGLARIEQFDPGSISPWRKSSELRTSLSAHLLRRRESRSFGQERFFAAPCI